MGKINREAEQYEPYVTRGEMVYDVALYYDLNGKMNVELNGASVEEFFGVKWEGIICSRLFETGGDVCDK